VIQGQRRGSVKEIMARAVILDFDGVLVESFDIKFQAFVRLMEPYGPEAFESAKHRNPFGRGLTRSVAIRRFFKDVLRQELSQAEEDRLVGRFGELVEDAVIHAPLVQGVQGFLEGHAERMDLFVVSSTPHGELERIISARGLATFFKGVRGFPPAKTDLIGAVIAERNLNPAEVVVVGDTTEDERAASMAGVRFVGRVVPGRPAPFAPNIPLIRDFADSDIVGRLLS
jgi:phosphoglycolate phosphatase-like HAD superfamily hydrolase